MYRVKIAAALGLSLSAFGLLGFGFVWSAQATAPPRAAIERAAIERAAIEPEAPRPEPDPELGVASSPSGDASAAAPAPSTSQTDDGVPAETAESDDTVEMPDLHRRTALRALRRLREIGIEAVIRDDRGQPVRIYERRYRTVIEQSVEAGTAIAPGASVELTVRGSARALPGY